MTEPTEEDVPGGCGCVPVVVVLALVVWLLMGCDRLGGKAEATGTNTIEIPDTSTPPARTNILVLDYNWPYGRGTWVIFGVSNLTPGVWRIHASNGVVGITKESDE